MGHHVLSHPSLEGAHPVSYLSSPEYDEIWKEAEQMTAILLGQIQPSKRSEESRKAVINYVKRLIERELDCKVQQPFLLQSFISKCPLNCTVVLEKIARFVEMSRIFACMFQQLLD